MSQLLAFAAFVAGSLGASQSHAPASTDEALVRAAVLDYVEALYNVQPDRVTRSVSPELTKYGHFYTQDGESRWAAMSYIRLLELASQYTPRDIQILDLQPNIANAKLRASWGVDYLLLTKGVDGGWQIRQVLWEGNPPRAR